MYNEENLKFRMKEGFVAKIYVKEEGKWFFVMEWEMGSIVKVDRIEVNEDEIKETIKLTKEEEYLLYYFYHSSWPHMPAEPANW